MNITNAQIDQIFLYIWGMKKQYVYTIAYNGEVMYVGKTRNMAKRKSAHRTKRGTHKSAIPVDADLSKIEFNVVAEFNSEEEALKYEDQLILQYDTIDNGWNKYRSGLIKSSDIKAYNRDYSAAYYQVHKEEKAAYNRDYNSAHKEDIAAYNRAYNAAHKEEAAAYRAAHREEINAKRRERRARKKAEVITPAS